MMTDPVEIYQKLKRKPTLYDEETHCPMLLKILMNNDKGAVCYFCTEALVCERTFWNWIKEHDLFAKVYFLGNMFARRKWEERGNEIRDMTMPIGTISYAFEHWKLIGWSRFGVSKNSRIKLKLNPKDTPDKHYAQLLEQASEGEFTAGEIKQLMEAVNVGLNTHQAFELQRQIDELKSDLEVMSSNTNVKNTVTNKGTA